MVTEAEYWDALQSRICAHCSTGDGSGGCALSNGEECPLKKHLPLIIEAVNSVYSKSIGPYEEQLRTRVCGVCSSQSAEGNCRLRAEAKCALDRYFPLIVHAIEDTQLKKRLHLGSQSSHGSRIPSTSK